jgi:transcriptional regulator with XRE-family HTH domain
MMNQHRLPERIAIAPNLLTQYRQERITLQELADRYGVSVTTVWRELKRLGASRGSRRGRPVSTQRRALVLALANGGWSRQRIAESLGLTPEWVRSILAENGLAVSLNILTCGRCGAAVATGHKAYQPGRDVLCAGCLRGRPDLPFPQRLKALRLAGNLSMAQLSSRCGLSRTAVGGYERGQARPTGASARKLARALGVSLPALLGGSRS